MEAPLLTPQIKGRLAQQEQSLIELIQAGRTEQFRASISLDPLIALEGVRAADRDQRDFSKFVSVLIREHTSRRAAPSGAHAELIAKLQAVPADEQPAVVAQLGAALRKSQRPRRLISP